MHYLDLFPILEKTRLHPWVVDLKNALQTSFENYTHGEFSDWQKIITELPSLNATEIELFNKVKIGDETDCLPEQQKALKQILMKFHPWRKGPFSLFGIDINTEWRSDWKWQRLQDHIQPLTNRLVLDVGCGNGYHCWRMLGAGAKLVLGIDPSQKYLMQFEIIRHYADKDNIFFLPLGIESMPEDMENQGFDTVFSMGVLYHRRSPIDHLIQLKQLLRPKGELVLETLIVDGDVNTVFLPQGRYAQMRNVWFLPSAKALKEWLSKVGFRNIQLINISQTSPEEQRSTEWMTFHSLKNFLTPNNLNLTIEGYPAPKRAILVAER